MIVCLSIRERKRNTEKARFSLWFTSPIPTMARSWEHNPDLPGMARVQGLEPSAAVSQTLHWEKAGVRVQNWDPNPSTPLWDTSVLESRVNAQSSVSFPYSCLYLCPWAIVFYLVKVPVTCGSEHRCSVLHRQSLSPSLVPTIHTKASLQGPPRLDPLCY